MLVVAASAPRRPHGAERFGFHGGQPFGAHRTGDERHALSFAREGCHPAASPRAVLYTARPRPGYTMKLAERMSRIGIESAFEVLARARALEKQGQEHHPPGNRRAGFPDAAAHRRGGQARARRRLDEVRPHPGPPRIARGHRRLRLAGRAASRSRRENVCVVPGGKPIMFFAMMALLEPGDEVIYPDPGFPIYESMIRFLGATPVPMPLVESRGFSFDLDTLRARLSPKTKMVILNSPANPTGGVIPDRGPRARSRTCCATAT